MGSKKAILILLGLLALVLLISSEVSAEAASLQKEEINGVGDAKYGGSYGGRYNDRGRARGGDGYPGRGGRGGGYPGRGGGGGGGYCRYGCCGGSYRGSCRRCCSYAGQAINVETHN